MATLLKRALRLSGSLLRPPYPLPAGFRVTNIPACKFISMLRPSSSSFESLAFRAPCNDQLFMHNQRQVWLDTLQCKHQSRPGQKRQCRELIFACVDTHSATASTLRAMSYISLFFKSTWDYCFSRAFSVLRRLRLSTFRYHTADGYVGCVERPHYRLCQGNTNVYWLYLSRNNTQ